MSRLCPAPRGIVASSPRIHIHMLPEILSRAVTELMRTIIAIVRVLLPQLGRCRHHEASAEIPRGDDNDNGDLVLPRNEIERRTAAMETEGSSGSGSGWGGFSVLGTQLWFFGRS